MANCPLSGKPCSFDKVFKISEDVNDFTHTTRCCRNCAADYINLRNQAAIQEAAAVEQAAGYSATDLISKILGIDLNALSAHVGKQIVVEKVGDVVHGENGPVILPMQKSCPGCGLTLTDLRQSKRMGCQQCYTAFEKELANFLPRIHGGKAKHTGKVTTPKSKPTDGEGIPVANQEGLVKILNDQLKLAVEAEDYAKAAQVRDLIKKYGGSTDGGQSPT